MVYRPTVPTVPKEEVALKQSLRVDGQSQRARRNTWKKFRASTGPERTSQTNTGKREPRP